MRFAGSVGTRGYCPIYDVLAVEARRAGLPLHWQPRLPNSRLTLGAAEWTRQQPTRFAAYQRALFQAHFADGLDIGDGAVLLRLATGTGVDTARLETALGDGTAVAAVASAEQSGHRLGVSGTPAWMNGGRAVVGNQSAATFEHFAMQLKSFG